MRIFIKIQQIIPIPSCCVPFNHFIRRDMSKYYAVYFVGDNQANNRVRIESSRTSNRGAFLDSFAALMKICFFYILFIFDKYKVRYR